MTYNRVTEGERILICRWRQEKVSIREIGRRLGRSASTISREIRRNSGGRGYRAKQAHEKALERARRPGVRRFTEAVRSYVEEHLGKGWTPEAISGRLRLEGLASVCKETIYKYIYADYKAGGKLWLHLPRSHRKRRRRCSRKDGRGRGRIPNQRSIDSRPAEVATRQTAGQWEGDLIQGAAQTGYLITIVERKSRYTLLARTESKEAGEVTAIMSVLFQAMPSALRQGLTLDNGKEFAFHEQLSQTTGLEVFFAHPYHAWERGSNENTNGLIRRLYPKGSSFREIGNPELQLLDRYLNDRPKKCLGWKTPREEMNAFLVGTP